MFVLAMHLYTIVKVLFSHLYSLPLLFSIMWMFHLVYLSVFLPCMVSLLLDLRKERLQALLKS